MLNCYEVVKEVNGYKIKRMIGGHGQYFIELTKRKSIRFKTIKAGAAYAESH